MLHRTIAFILLSMVFYTINVLAVYEGNNTISAIFYIATVICVGLSSFFAGKFDDDYKKLKDKVNKLEHKE